MEVLRDSGGVEWYGHSKEKKEKKKDSLKRWIGLEVL